MARHYLDHAASSPMPAEVAAVVAEQLGRIGNPSSLHSAGRRARQVVEESRESLAADLGCHPTEIVFTSGGTEADNLIMIGGWSARRPGRPRVIASAVEHPAVIDCLSAIGSAGGDPQPVEVDGDGRLDHDRLDDLLRVPTAVTSIMWVNNETGVITDPASWVDRTRAAGSWAHSDAVQAAGVLEVDFGASGLDAMTVSAHKLGGPVGVGALVLRRGLTPDGIGHGGGQERKLRSGTVPTALIAGFAAATRRAVTARGSEHHRLAGLSARLRSGVLDRVARVRLHGAGAERSPAVVHLGFDGVRADDLLLLLDQRGIDCSTGSACTAGVSGPSEVLLAMGRTPAQATAALRFSLGWSTTTADVDAVIDALPDLVTRARLAHG